MTSFIVLPGIGGSSEEHWQTHWEATDPRMRRFSPASWEHPELEDWMLALDEAVARSNEPPVLVAHSLACLLVAHWQANSNRTAKGAFLVATPDPSTDAFPDEAAQFAEAPGGRFRLPALMLASTNDPYASVAYSRWRAADWNCDVAFLGPLGHINGASGLGPWQEGRDLLDDFAKGLC